MSKKADTQKGTNGPPVRDVNAAQRVTLALNLRASKLSYAAIAAQVGYSNATACRRAILRELDRTVVEGVDALRKQELALLDALHTECWSLAMDKSSKSRLFAVDRLLTISEARRRLMGLDTPTDTGVTPGLVVVREAPPGYFGTPAPALPASSGEVQG